MQREWWLQANGLAFRAGLGGSGPPVVFIGGTGGDLRKPTSPFHSPLIEHGTVLCWDQRGMGRSDKPPGPYRLVDYAEDTRAILDALDWQQVPVIGYSFGGMVAQELALRWPQRVSRLLLLGTTAGGEGGASYPLHELEGLPPDDYARRRLEIIDTAFDSEWQQANPVEARQRIDRQMQADLLYADEPDATAGRRAQLAARAAHDTWDRLTALSMPVHVLAGTRDGQAPLAAQQAMASRIRGCSFDSIDSSHAMLTESDAAWHWMVRRLFG